MKILRAFLFGTAFSLLSFAVIFVLGYMFFFLVEALATKVNFYIAFGFVFVLFVSFAVGIAIAKSDYKERKKYEID